ncbi:GNAT family protein [Planococcus sp. ISL-109]|uniref:GNAT family N-acetyltransferase n=1 Tax=Planococcus sp. ISL-109 TaxID=2819166 RepID=UPI001BEC6E51|nr:GNAT family protein [Planococcus sp. ISL-109]MBT2583180.1 GNAT family N-acetyltransferase [Planococcus sp. ISL-109]
MELIGKKIFIRFFEDKDALALLDMQLRNSDFFQQYAPTFGNDFYTLDAKQQYISNCAQQRLADQQYTFGIFLKETGTLVGDVSLARIVRGPLQRGLLGYSLDQQYNGRGYATEAVSLAVQFAFDNLKLHRVEAGVMLRNIGSMRVLEKAGFHKEGIEQKGVKINGQWEDHQMFAIISNRN